MTKEIVDLMLSYEKSVAGLYDSYANRFPEYKAFWEELASEEIDHAATIEELLGKIDDKTIFYDGSRFKVPPLKIALDYVMQKTRQAEEGDVTLLSALSIAEAIETSVIEAKFYEIFEGDSAYLNHYLRKLHDETADHRKKVQQLLNQVRQKNV